MKLNVRFYKTEAELDNDIEIAACDAYGFAEDGTRHPCGYHAYKIVGSPDDLDCVEELLPVYALGSWRTFRFHGSTDDVLCIEFF